MSPVRRVRLTALSGEKAILTSIFSQNGSKKGEKKGWEVGGGSLAQDWKRGRTRKLKGEEKEEEGGCSFVGGVAKVFCGGFHSQKTFDLIQNGWRVFFAKEILPAKPLYSLCTIFLPKNT